MSLFTKGYTNQDVLTNADSIAQFEAGEAAMTMEGTWSIAEFQEKMGDKVGVFVPPFTSEPIKGIVEYGGDGFAMTTYSQHKEQAAAFLAFLASDEAQPIVASSGLIPAKDGFSTDSRMAKDLLAFAADNGFTRYPMIDNVMQPEVSDAGTRVLNAAFGGSMSVDEALTNLQADAGGSSRPIDAARNTSSRRIPGPRRAEGPPRPAFDGVPVVTDVAAASPADLDQPRRGVPRSTGRLKRAERRAGILFVLPVVVLYAVMLALPIAQTFYYSLTEWNGITATWLGPENYRRLFSDPTFWRVVLNNILLLAAIPVAILDPAARWPSCSTRRSSAGASSAPSTSCRRPSRGSSSGWSPSGSSPRGGS